MSSSDVDLGAIAQDLMRRLPAPGVSVETLRLLLEAGQLTRHASGHRLCQEGAPSLGMWFLLGGKIHVERTDPGGQPRQLATIEAPAMVGQMGMVDREKRSATVVADTPVTLVELNTRTFDQLIGDPSEAGFGLRQIVLTSLTRQLAGANMRLVQGSQKIEQETQRAERAEQVDLLGVTDLLEGWDVNAPELDEMEVVYTEDQRRNPKNTHLD